MKNWFQELRNRFTSQHHRANGVELGNLAAVPAQNDMSQTVPIREIKSSHTARIQKHLKTLGADDRYLRFGYAATDQQINDYVATLDFERDSLFGIYNRRLDLIAMAHLSYSIDPDCASCAEFGVSVATASRGRGYGTRLFDRSITHARNEGVRMLFVHALSENTAMLKIAKRAGASIERDGSDSQAHMLLPPANFDSRVEEMFDQQVAWTDYQLKTQAKQFWSWLGMNRPKPSGTQT